MVRRRNIQIILPIILVLQAACAAGPPMDLSEQVFPPSSILPLNAAITPPLVPVSFGAGHKALMPWDESPGQRRLLMQCVWNDGLKNMIRMMIPGTTFTNLAEARNPLGAMGSSVQTEIDSLGMVYFSLSGNSVLDAARHHGWTHLIVPYEIKYFSDKKKGDLTLTAHAAIVDVLEQRIVWQGTIDSRRITEKSLGPDDSKQPQLTDFESTTYRFILDLAKIMGRPLNSNPDSRHELARPCQDPPPLLQIPMD